MKSVTISGSIREQVGKKNAKKLRNQEMVPCILYGGEKQLFFSAEEKSFKNLVYSPEVYTAKLDIEGKQYQAVLQDIQFHPVSDRIIHIDFLEFFEDKKITMNIPVNVVGDSIGVLEGGQLIVKLRKIRARAIPDKLPDNVEVNIEDIPIGGSIKIEDLELDDVELLDAPNSVILRVKSPRELIEIEPAEEIGEEGEEGEEGEGEEGAEEGAEGTEGAKDTEGAKAEGSQAKPGDAGAGKAPDGQKQKKSTDYKDHQ